MYRQRLHYFDFQGMDEQLVKDFETFVIRNLKPFFDNLDMMGKKLKLPWTYVTNILREGSKNQQLLKSLANTIDMRSSNNSKYKDIHQQYIFYVILYESNSIQALLKKIDIYLSELTKESFTWNKVYYGNYRERTFSVKW